MNARIAEWFEQISAWWRARTPREQLLVRIAAILIFLICIPAWAYLGASAYRAEAAARLETARQVESQVALLAAADQGAAATPSDDPSLRGRLLAAAQTVGLTVSRVEASGPDGVRVAFEPADSVLVYRWVAIVGRSGAYVARSTIVRVDDSELVTAEFEVNGSP
jgi:type II secretory pathway component PulM